MGLEITSAGGLVIRCDEDGWKTLLVGKGSPIIWRIPKGIVEYGETIEQTAEREVFEETGVRGEIIEFIGTEAWSYRYDEKEWDKIVHFFLMRYIGGNTQEHDNEFELVRWFGFEDAVNSLYYQSEVKIIEKAKTMID